MAQIAVTNITLHEKVVAKCEGCGHIVDPSRVCSCYMSPSAKWRSFSCPMATHLIRVEAVAKKKRNPMKQAKMASRGKR